MAARSSFSSGSQKGGKKWFQQCQNMISYAGSGISSPQAKSMLSEVWKQGQALSLEGDDLCKWALKEVQPELDRFLSDRNIPTRQLVYSPTGIYQQYGALPGTKHTFWRYNPIRGFPPLSGEDYESIVYPALIGSEEQENFYIQSQTIDQEPRSKLNQKVSKPRGPRKTQPVEFVPKFVPPAPVFVQTTTKHAPIQTVVPQRLRTTTMRAPPKATAPKITFPAPPPPILVDPYSLPTLDFIPPPEEEHPTLKRFSQLSLSATRQPLAPAQPLAPTISRSANPRPIGICLVGSPQLRTQPSPVRGAGARPAQPSPTRFKSNY